MITEEQLQELSQSFNLAYGYEHSDPCGNKERQNCKPSGWGTPQGADSGHAERVRA